MAENKKESFTFSDKIKNSKPASSPFSKRASSKIGSNGKPKQTLFERTRRDAPFFIAAAAALLMLPFLYKYSGTVNEAPIIAPGSDSVFEPERFDYDPTGDPSGDIMQLAGRDPLSLIKGARSAGDEEGYPERYDIDDDYGRDNPSVSSPEPYRKAAPAATRAAFQRTFTPTKINEMRGASMNLRGGGGIGTRFGGAELRRAARQSSAGAPARGTKPVSLTPLRAAGSPTRSYFGQGGAAQARASRDAMSKANAPAALRDAMFAPIENGKLAGLGTGAFGAGGGAGKWDRNMNFKGITPWWWDMMKQQEMEKWKWRYFLFRKPLADLLAKFIGEAGFNLGCCLLTGSDDCSAETFFGGSKGAEKEPTCCGKKANKIAALIKSETGLDFGKEGCNNFKTKMQMSGGSCPGGWKEPAKYDRKLGFLGVRGACLGMSVRGKGETELKDRFNCEAIDTTRNFELQATGKATNWHKYHAVVVRNEVPFKVAGQNFLCGNANIRWNKQDGSGVGNMAKGSSERNVQTMRHAKGKAMPNPQEHMYAGQDEYSMGLLGDNSNDYCVIYVAEGAVFNWDNFKVSTEMLLDQLKVTDQNGKAMDGLTAFPQLKLEFIEGYAMKNTLSRNLGAKGTNVNGRDTGKKQGMPLEMLPMKYVEFETAYVLHRSRGDGKYRENAERSFAETYTGEDGSTRTTLANDRKETAIRTSCEFGAFRITADPIQSTENITGVLSFAPKHGANGRDIAVKVALKIGEGDKAVTLGPVEAKRVDTDPANSATTQKFILDNKGILERLNREIAKNKDVAIEAIWTAEYHGKVSQDQADYYSSEKPAENITVATQCKPGDTKTEKNADGCDVTYTCQKNGFWDGGTVDPNCGRTNTEIVKVGFFPTVGAIPGSVEDELKPANRQAGANNVAAKQFGTCAELNGVSNVPLLNLDDSDVKAVMARAKQKYDKANEGVSILSYDENKITVANLLDALTILQGEQLPINAVCMLGKTIGAASTDPQRPSVGGRKFNNMFGTFAAYIGNDSSFFPTNNVNVYVEGTKNTIPDWRFRGCGRGISPEMKSYHYGYYNWNAGKLHDQADKGGQDDRMPFENELANGVWRGAPLSPIAKAVGYQRLTEWDNSKGARRPLQDSMDKQNRDRYHAAYKHVFFTDGSCNLSGNMSYDNVKQYITSLCKEGSLSQKPKNGSRLECGHRFTEDTFAAER